MAGKDFVVDKRGLGSFLVSAPMRAAMTAAGRDVAAEAARTAPRQTGALAGSFEVTPTTARVKTRDGTQERASGRVSTTVSHAPAVEFGHLAGDVKGHQGFRFVVPGAHTLGRLARSKAALAATAARRRK